MTRWEKLSDALLHLVSEIRQQRGALVHVSSAFGRALDQLERIESKIDEIHASHAKANREITALDARVTRAEKRSGTDAE